MTAAGLLTLSLAAACRPPVPAPTTAGGPSPVAATTATTVTPRAAVTPRPATTPTTIPTVRRGGGGGGGGGGARAPRPTTTSTTAPRPTTTVAPTTTTTTPARGSVLWQADYGPLGAVSSLLGAWQAEQEVAPDRITSVDTDRGPAMRVELRPGDAFGGSSASRAEVYARHASPRSTPADQWPDPMGSTRWYGVDVQLASDWATDPTGRVWMSVMQWKGLDGGQPAIALEIKRDRFELAGASGRNDLGAIKPGEWERFVIGVHFHPDADEGWIEVYRDGQQVLPRTHRPTQQWLSPGVVDPTYLKQGIYRDPRWTATHVAHFGPTTIGTTKDDVR